MLRGVGDNAVALWWSLDKKVAGPVLQEMALAHWHVGRILTLGCRHGLQASV